MKRILCADHPPQAAETDLLLDHETICLGLAVLPVAHRRSDDPPPRELRARLRPHRNGRAGAPHLREQRGRGRSLHDPKGDQFQRPVAGESARRIRFIAAWPFNIDGGRPSSSRCWQTARSSRCRWKAGRRCTTRSAATLRCCDDLNAGRVPEAWTPLETTTTEEVVFLAPLDPVSARGRAKVLFGFDYIWEVYKPEHQRKFGYYTLPVLWGDRLVARFDSKLDRTTNTFVILGLWLEDVSPRRQAPGSGEASAATRSLRRHWPAGLPASLPFSERASWMQRGFKSRCCACAYALHLNHDNRLVIKHATGRRFAGLRLATAARHASAGRRTGFCIRG